MKRQRNDTTRGARLRSVVLIAVALAGSLLVSAAAPPVHRTIVASTGPAIEPPETEERGAGSGTASAEVTGPAATARAGNAPTDDRATPSPAAADRPTVDVRAMGAVGDGTRNDRAAIQRANDAVARRGGGIVHFPPGTYVASGLVQDSNVTFSGTHAAVLQHPDGVTAEPIVTSRVRYATGDIVRGSNELRVGDTSPFIVGGLVAVRAAGGPSRSQRAKLAGGTGDAAAVMRLSNGRGFADGSTFTPNFLIVGDQEVISYTARSKATLVGVARSLYGTKASRHKRGTPVAQATVLYARVLKVTSGKVILDRPARFGVRRAPVSIGAVGTEVVGLTLDGGRVTGGSDVSNPMPVEYRLATSARVASCLIRNGDHGAVSFDMGTTRSSVVDNVLVNTGTPTRSLGAAVWLFRGASRNVVAGNTIGGDSVNGVYLDDRTIQSTEYDAGASKNLIQDNSIKIGRVGSNIGIAVLGSSDNRVVGNSIAGTAYGIRVYTGGQSAAWTATVRNVVEANRIERHRYGIWVNGQRNTFRANTLLRNEVAVLDRGKGNTFE